MGAVQAGVRFFLPGAQDAETAGEPVAVHCAGRICMFRQRNHAEALAGLMNLLQVHAGCFITVNHMGMPFFCKGFWRDLG